MENDGCELKDFDQRCHYHKKHPQTMPKREGRICHSCNCLAIHEVKTENGTENTTCQNCGEKAVRELPTKQEGQNHARAAA